MNGKTYTDVHDILEKEVKSYDNLYHSDKTEITKNKDSISQTQHDVKLSDADANSCEGHFTLLECNQAIKEMKCNKSPELDGLTIEFYNPFRDILGPVLTNVLNEGYNISELTYTQRTGFFIIII